MYKRQPQAVADALGNIIGTQEHDTAFLLQLVVQADEIVEHRFGQLAVSYTHLSTGRGTWYSTRPKRTTRT